MIRSRNLNHTFHHLIFMLGCVIFCNTSYLNAQVPVSTNVESKNAVIIDFTGVRCAPCINAHKAISAAKRQYPEILNISIHSGDFAEPYDIASGDELDLRTEAGDTVADNIAYSEETGNQLYMVSMYPTLLLNGKGIAYIDYLDTLEFIDKVTTVKSQDAFVNIASSAILDTNSRLLKLRVESYYTGTSINENFLHVQLTQDDMVTRQLFIPDYVHHGVFRMTLTPLWGESLGQPQIGDLIVREYEIQLPDSIYYEGGAGVYLDLNNIQINAFISYDHQLVDALNLNEGQNFPNKQYLLIENGARAQIERTAGVNDSSVIFDCVKLYPNPAGNLLTIDLTNYASEGVRVEIYSQEGKLVSTNNLQQINNQIDISHLPEGGYLISIQKGEQRIVQQLLKSK